MLRLFASQIRLRTAPITYGAVFAAIALRYAALFIYSKRNRTHCCPTKFS